MSEKNPCTITWDWLCTLLPIYLVEYPIIRYLSKFYATKSRKYETKTILKLVEVDEEQIWNELKATIGCFMHYEWTSNATHYLGVFAIYSREMRCRSHGVLLLQKSWRNYWFQWVPLQNEISRILNNQTMMLKQPILAPQPYPNSWKMYLTFSTLTFINVQFVKLQNW